MVEISVRLLGSLSEFSEGKDLHLRFDKEPTMEDIVRILVIDLGPAFERTLLDPIVHNPLPRALILVRGFEISVLQGMDTVLKDGDDVVILPVSHGG